VNGKGLITCERRQVDRDGGVEAVGTRLDLRGQAEENSSDGEDQMHHLLTMYEVKCSRTRRCHCDSISNPYIRCVFTSYSTHMSVGGEGLASCFYHDGRETITRRPLISTLYTHRLLA